MRVDCQRIQPSSKTSIEGLTITQSDSKKGGKKSRLWFVCKTWPTFTSKFTSPLTASKKFNLQPLDCLVLQSLLLAQWILGCRGLTNANDTFCKGFVLFSNTKSERDNTGCNKAAGIFPTLALKEEWTPYLPSCCSEYFFSWTLTI